MMLVFRFARRAIVPALAVLVALAILAALAGVRGPMPATSAAGSAPPAEFPPERIVNAPEHPVRIVTDRWGIPHLRAESLDDLYFAWGWVTARDRLWQLMYSRQAARGELWRWLGNSKLEDDGGAQLFELATRAHRIWLREAEKPETNAALSGFALGVQRYIAECRRGERPWPREFARLGVTPDTWNPEDSFLLLLAQGMVLDFAVPEFAEGDALAKHGRAWSDARYRFENAYEYRTIPDSAARRLFGAAHDARPGAASLTATERDAAAFPRDLAARAHDALGAWRSDATDDPELRASNVFAVGGHRSAHGRPMLANDPHLALAAPGPLYVVHVSVPGQVDAIGACVPGLPSIVSGRNRDVAWGITALSADVIDVYADSLSADGHRVRWNGGWTPLREDPFTMRFRLPGGFTVPAFGQKRRYSPHGPVLVYDRKHHLAFSAHWAVDDVAIRLDRLLGLERATSAEDLVARYRAQVTPGLNVIAADTRGRVIYQTVGTVPRRGFDPGRGPLPDDGRHEWSGLVSPDSMPEWRAPADGYVVNSNNTPAVAPGLEPWPRYDFAHDRASRIAERLAGDRNITLEDLGSVQNDVRSKGAERFVPRLLRCADSMATILSPRARAALDTLRGWDFAARRNRVAPTLFRAWYGALQRRSQLDGLQGLTAAALDGRAPDALVRSDGVVERPAVAASAALDTALARLDGLLGPSMAHWQWGRAHRARFKHALRERDAAFDPPLVAADGDNSTPCVGRSSLPWNTEFSHAPVFRHLVDLAVPDSSLGIVVPGNGAEGPHAHDLAGRWANHGYVPFLMDWKRIEAVQESEVVLGRVR